MMAQIKKRYIVDEENNPVGIILDLETFQEMEELVEDQLFGKILEEAAKEEPLTLDQARRRYARMKKRS